MIKYKDIETLISEDIEVYYKIDKKKFCWTNKISSQDLEFNEIKDLEVISLNVDTEYLDEWHPNDGEYPVLIIELKKTDNKQ